MAQTLDTIRNYPGMEEGMITTALDGAVAVIRENLPVFTEKFQSSNSFDGFYEPTENVEWTTGFWTGSIWLAYEHTGDEAFKQAADIQVESFLERIEKKIDVNHHDMGFLYSLSCVAAYKLTGNEHAKKAALLAADHLAERYREKGNFLQAWGNPGEPKEYRLIIDCLLNLPILYWATEVTGDESYAQKAENHIKTAMKCILRPDNSTYHTHFFDVETGEPTYGVTHQGNRNGSAWARGQAWGVYGIALSYRYLKNPEYIDLFCRLLYRASAGRSRSLLGFRFRYGKHRTKRFFRIGHRCLRNPGDGQIFRSGKGRPLLNGCGPHAAGSRGSLRQHGHHKIQRTAASRYVCKGFEGKYLHEPRCR